MDEIELKRHPETGELIQEEWRDVENYSGCYKISNYGRVKSLKRKTVPKDKIIKRRVVQGYYYAVLCKNGNTKHVRVHRLIAKAFHPNPENKRCVNHIDGNKENNFYLNLEWCTYSENMKHAVKNSLANTDGLINGIGEDNVSSKLTEKDVLEIRRLKEEGELFQYQIAEKFNVTPTLVSYILNGKFWTHV